MTTAACSSSTRRDRRLAFADDAEGHLVAAGDPEASPLRGVALGDTLAELAAVGLGLVGLADEWSQEPGSELKSRSSAKRTTTPAVWRWSSTAMSVCLRLRRKRET
jgi:hypothetical protein